MLVGREADTYAEKVTSPSQFPYCIAGKVRFSDQPNVCVFDLARTRIPSGKM